MRITGLVGALATTAAVLTACEATPCKPTSTAARDAAVADIKSPLKSAVLEAWLTSGGKAVGSRLVEFRVDDSGGVIGEATTNAAGVARLDLKRRPTTLVDPVRGGSYRAVFEGDVEYCSSLDAAKFKPVSAR